ncbi:MAG: hypothetical protein GWN55_11290 [Phycisphaerae bacterium]|nr:hypothetical protein [Phycisphaerae bacterium]NIS54077.1 hypothetical protein [Phycisphaerae bacterium]NIV01883.1 hypothetical protein [Phycisphaerae bacterium]NIX01821.1 hypothetical protein [Phycisphaerae bacterium]NIX31567.1 hypothetical protein [Phycisphaerae bacterium]
MTELQKYLRKAHTKLCCASVTAWILFFISLNENIKSGLNVWERFFSLNTLHLLLVIMIIGFSLFAFHDCGEAMKEEKSRTEKD